MRSYKRSIRVSDLIREEVADIVQYKIKHKTLGFVTITGAKVSDDLRHAIVYVSCLNIEDINKVTGKLNSTAPFIKSELGKRLKMKFIPTLSFRADDSIIYGLKIDKLFEGINTERNDSADDEDLL